jgi:hypothetical protein
MSKRTYDYALIFRGLEGGERNLSLLEPTLWSTGHKAVNDSRRKLDLARTFVRA